MPDIAIKVENLGKRYRIGLEETKHDTLIGAITSWLSAPFSNFQKLKNLRHFGNNEDAKDIVWALRNICFEVNQGEVVGIIGRNGAGKSTLLKVLSQITEPSEGRAIIRGRMSSLLEVGTGFHPDLTGRENVYLNGTILGMSKNEIDKRFDEIIAFSGIERFIDTPVKRYSSGMKVRLAFSVAAHLEPEILLIDEVLSVGDADFQKKCLNKMEDVSHEGRTVLYVSHNMPSVLRLCPRVILLDQGGIKADAPSQEAIKIYLQSGLGTTAYQEWPDIQRAPGDEIVRLRIVRVLGENGNISEAIDIRQDVKVEMVYEVLQGGKRLIPRFCFYNEDGICVFEVRDVNSEWSMHTTAAGYYVSTVTIPGNLLAAGTLMVSVGITALVPYQAHLYERDVVAFQVIESLERDSARGDYPGSMPGIVWPKLKWTRKVGSKQHMLMSTGSPEMP